MQYATWQTRLIGDVLGLLPLLLAALVALVVAVIGQTSVNSGRGFGFGDESTGLIMFGNACQILAVAIFAASFATPIIKCAFSFPLPFTLLIRFLDGGMLKYAH
jgi:hypothetical protein